MSMTASDWLNAREILDARSRSKELAMAFASVIGPDSLVVDLACGTGTNIRYLAPLFASNQKWVGVDHDSEMLSEASNRLPGVQVEFEKLNLSSELSRVPAGPGFAVTASAFLDLASELWLTQFARHCRDTPLLVAMSTTSQPSWYPSHELDESIRSRLESHQRSDHGFGPSLGPDAANFLTEQLHRNGCQVSLRESDWALDTNDSAIIEMMIGGVARRVGITNDPIDAREWATQRRAQLQRGELRWVIKHVDLLSLPPSLV